MAGPLGDALAPRFAARGLAPGTYALVVWAGPFLPTVVEPVTLDGTTSPGLVTVELMRRGASVAGRVLTPTGAARANAASRSKPADATLTPADGAHAGRRRRGRALAPRGPAAAAATGARRRRPGARRPNDGLNLLEREERALDLVP